MQKSGRVFLILICLFGLGAITEASLEYFTFEEELPSFVEEKLPLARPELFLFVVRVHVVAAVFSLGACLMLLSKRMLQRLPSVHRWLGRVTGFIVLLLLVPSGCYLAFFARAGLASTVGFLLSGGIVAWATVWGVITARARQFVAHRMCMRHLFAQLSVAVTSRILLVALSLTSMDADWAYLFALWGPVLGSALVAHQPYLPRMPLWPYTKGAVQESPLSQPRRASS